MMSHFLRNAAIKFNNFTAINTNYSGVPYFLLRQSSKYFSTQLHQTDSSSSSSSSIDPFLQNTTQGLVYGKLLGITKHTLKSDIINLLEGCHLNPDDIKITYNPSYIPRSSMIQFSSRTAFDNAVKVIGRKGRLYKLDLADRSHWDVYLPHDGKSVLLEGIPPNAVPEDVERFLSGFDYDSSSIRLFMRLGAALVRFHTRTEAMNAFITKNRGFCLNNQISVRVLQ